MTTTIPFPTKSPPGYSYNIDEPAFDPKFHLALEMPSDILMLTDLGYTKEEIANKQLR